MYMQEFPANSAKARARSEGPPQDVGPDRIERITSAEADRRRKGVGRRFKEIFIAGDPRSAVDFALTEIVIPEIRDVVYNAIQGGFDRWIYGEGRRSRRYGNQSVYSDNPPRTNYQSYSTTRPPTSSGTRMLSRQARVRHDFDEIVISSRAEATEVLDQMFEFLSRFGVVKVSELYDMVGIRSDHTDHKWGWTSLPGAQVRPMKGGKGYLLDLPEPQSL